MNHPVRVLAGVVLALAVAGCQSIDYAPVKLDSSAPFKAPHLEPCPQTLLANESCTTLVFASQWMSPTGIHVKAGETYCVSVPPNQVWFDASRRNTPPQGEEGNGIMKLANKRHPKSAFFSLMASSKLGDEETAGAAQDVSIQGLFKSPKPGELVLYPNDALGPQNDPAYYYKNNSGQIWVTIRQCTESTR